MRLWNVPVHLMCDKHLRGEHVECHMFVGSIMKGTSMKGFIEDGLFDPSLLKSRHDELAAEMEGRGGTHASPLESPVYEAMVEFGCIDVGANIEELARRCPDCYDRISKTYRYLPFPRGGDKVFEGADGKWHVQLTGLWLPVEYTSRAKALKALERMRRNMTLRRQGRQVV